MAESESVQKITPLHFLPKFCSRCGGPLAKKFIEEEDCERLHCARCGAIAYVNPLLVAGAIPEQDGKIVLLRRGIEPMRGAWTYPAGFVELWETVEAGAARETEEETGLRIETGGVIGVYSYPDNAVVTVVYRARVSGGQARISREALEVRAFSKDEIPWKELAFRSTADALKDYCGKT